MTVANAWQLRNIGDQNPLNLPKLPILTSLTVFPAMIAVIAMPT
jgi:hypothetical protein